MSFKLTKLFSLLINNNKVNLFLKTPTPIKTQILIRLKNHLNIKKDKKRVIFTLCTRKKQRN